MKTTKSWPIVPRQLSRGIRPFHAHQVICNCRRVGAFDRDRWLQHHRLAAVLQRLRRGNGCRLPVPAHPDRQGSTASITGRSCAIDTSEKPGTIIVDTQQEVPLLRPAGRRGVRYGIGVGREGFEWNGTARVGAEARMAGLDAAAGNDRASAEAGQVCRRHAAGPDERARRARPVPLQQGRRHGLSPARHARVVVDRQGDVVGLRPHASTRTSSTSTNAPRSAPR